MAWAFIRLSVVVWPAETLQRFNLF